MSVSSELSVFVDKLDVLCKGALSSAAVLCTILFAARSMSRPSGFFGSVGRPSVYNNNFLAECAVA